MSNVKGGSKKHQARSNTIHGRRVCKAFVLKTLCISQKRYQNAVSNGPDPTGQRGRSAPKNKTPEDCIQIVRAHIERLPVYVSHYSRRHNPNTRYLAPGTTVAMLYDNYVTWSIENRTQPASDYVYRAEFRKYNLKIHPPQSDTCSTCDELQMRIKNKG